MCVGSTFEMLGDAHAKSLHLPIKEGGSLHRIRSQNGSDYFVRCLRYCVDRDALAEGAKRLVKASECWALLWAANYEEYAGLLGAAKKPG